jgi:hypothetical protein
VLQDAGACNAQLLLRWPVLLLLFLPQLVPAVWQAVVLLLDAAAAALIVGMILAC